MKKNRQFYLWVINFFIAVTALVLVITVYLTVARATVIVPAAREQFKNSAVLDVAETSGEGTVTGRIITRTYELAETVPVGARTVKAEKAGSIVTITNESARSQSLVRTTRLLSGDNKLFRITQTILVPAGTSIDIFAEADQKGDSFLIGTSTFTIPGLNPALQKQIYGESKQPMTFDRVTSGTVTAEEVNKAEASLLDKLVKRAQEEFAAETQNNTVAKEHLQHERLALLVDPPIGKPASHMKLTLKLKISGLMVNPDDVLLQAKKKLVAQLAFENSLIEAVPESLTYAVTALNEKTKTGQLQTELSAWIRTNVATAQLDAQNLIGKKTNDARAYLQSQGIQDFEIKLFPSWMPRMPLLADHITVEVR